MGDLISKKFISPTIGVIAIVVICALAVNFKYKVSITGDGFKFEPASEDQSVSNKAKK